MVTIFVFERDMTPEADEPTPELDFRGERASLPCGAAPLAMVKAGQVTAIEGQWFTLAQVTALARRASGLDAYEQRTGRTVL